MTKPEILDAFRERGLRCTPQRYGVLDYLVRHPVHPTADQIHHAINRAHPRASRAGVYNALHTLVEVGLVREVVLEGNATRYDANIGDHHHFICDRCGGVEDVSELKLAFPEAGRRIRLFEVVLRGLCATCAASRAS